MEQAAFEPNNLVPGIGLRPDKMLLARGFSYADAHRARLGVNYKHIPVNTPKAPVHSYSKDGVMRTVNVTDPVYAPNSYGGPAADPSRADHAGLWAADGEMVRAAYTLRAADDDFGQPRTMVREVLDDDARERLVSNVAGTSWTASPRRCWHARSSTGRTSTRRSASASSRPSERRSAHGRCRDRRVRTGPGARRLGGVPGAM